MNRIDLLSRIDEIENYDVTGIRADVEELFDDIEDLEGDITHLKDDISDKNDEINELENRILELEDANPVEFENQTHNNLRTQSVFEELFKNIDYIPIDELEKFVEKYKRI